LKIVPGNCHATDQQPLNWLIENVNVQTNAIEEAEAHQNLSRDSDVP
jgi:hypothetical protein